MKLGISDAEVRYNPGGIAVSGDATLHGDDVYVSFNADAMCRWILYRKCNGKKDYTGGPNHSYPFEAIERKGRPRIRGCYL